MTKYFLAVAVFILTACGGGAGSIAPQGPLSCKLVATIDEPRGGVFALESFAGKLHIGLYSLTPSALHYTYPPLKRGGLKSSMLSSAESICALKSWNGALYANTEKSGEIFRSLNGMSWRKVKNSNFKAGCALEAHGPHLYCHSEPRW